MTTTPSPEGLQEPALREALRKSVEGWNNLVEFGIIPPQHRTAARILAEEGDAALKAAPPVPHDNGLRDALEPFANAARNCEMPVAQSAAKWLCWEDFARADRVLTTLPQQAATDESRYRDALERINQAVIDGQVCDDVAWFDKFTTLHDFIEETLRPSAPAAVADLFPTPTSQPPAAETRLNLATRLRNSIEALGPEGVGNNVQMSYEFANDLLAALTQPEPTAPQGGEEERAAELIRSYFDARQAGNDCPECGNEGPWEHCGPCSDRIGPVIARMSNFAINMDMHGEIAEGADKRDAVARIISLAKGAPENGQMSIGAWWWDKRHDRARPEHFEGECRDEDRRHADLMIPLLRAALSSQQAAGEAEAVAWLYTNDAGDKELLLDGRIESARRLLESGYTEQALYATPQPTETQRIVAIIRDVVRSFQDCDGDELAAQIRFRLDAIEAGEHLAGDKA